MMKFFLGEKKYVNFSVISAKEEQVVIPEATYVLKKDDVVEDSGNCTIQNNVISVLLEPAEAGQYVLNVTYSIPPETRIVTEEIDVNQV